MFTIDQIREAHSHVKSGADFPAYIQQLKALGILAYEHYVSDGHIHYYGANEFTRSTDAKWAARYVAAQSDTDQLTHSLRIHQQGQTDYSTFCQQAAEAGVEKWVVDLNKMTCTYLDRQDRELIVEAIPS